MTLTLPHSNTKRCCHSAAHAHCTASLPHAPYTCPMAPSPLARRSCPLGLHPELIHHHVPFTGMLPAVRWPSFFNSMCYEIGGTVLSLAEVRYAAYALSCMDVYTRSPSLPISLCTLHLTYNAPGVKQLGAACHLWLHQLVFHMPSVAPPSCSAHELYCPLPPSPRGIPTMIRVALPVPSSPPVQVEYCLTLPPPSPPHLSRWSTA